VLDTLSRFILALFEVIEAEAATAKRNVYEIWHNLLVMTFIALLFFVAFLLIVASLYLWLSQSYQPSISMFICSLFVLLASGVLVWVGKRS
jgi:hypothetical protein